MTPRQEQAAEVFRRTGSVAEVSRELGIHRRDAQRMLDRAGLDATARKAYKIDPAIKQGMDAVGTKMVPAIAWAKIPPKDGEIGYSLLLKPQEDTPEDIAERVRAALEGMEPAQPVVPPESVMEKQLTAYLLSDRHTGMMAWARETGEAYNTDLAVKRVKDWVARCVASSPPSHTALILDNGDGQHADDHTNQTPRSKHSLDVDTRHFRTLEADVEALAAAIELTKAKHRKVIVRVLAGNHNPTSWIALLFALAERYREDDRVEVIKDPSEFFVMEWGKVLIAAHHGDKAKADRLVHFIADEFAEMWGRTKHRYLFTGHLHSHKSQDIGGVTWEQLRAVTARDAYSYSNAYVARSQMQSITYDRDLGEVQRVKVGA